MRALIGLLVLLAAPAAAAAAKPLDADRSFARAGVLRMDGPIASEAVIALPGGGTLHATNGAGILRLSPRGRVVAQAYPAPAGSPEDMVAAPGGAVVIGLSMYETGKPTSLAVWRVDRDGRTLAHHEILLPGGESAIAQRVVRRGDGYAALVRDSRGVRSTIVALTADGALDTSWGAGGFRAAPTGWAGIGTGRRGELVVATALRTRCERNFTSRKERTVLRVQRLGRSGAQRMSRRLRPGRAVNCPNNDVGDVLVDSRGRITIGGSFASGAMVLRLRAGGTRDPRFGGGGTRSLDEGGLWTPLRLERRRGGYALGFVPGRSDAPFGHVGLLTADGRWLRTRRLKVSRNYPNSVVHDIAIDRRGGIVAAGQLHDTDLYIREDYGQPHLAVWRVRTR